MRQLRTARIRTASRGDENVHPDRYKIIFQIFYCVSLPFTEHCSCVSVFINKTWVLIPFSTMFGSESRFGSMLLLREASLYLDLGEPTVMTIETKAFA
jgi:hypothetical protein